MTTATPGTAAPEAEPQLETGGRGARDGGGRGGRRGRGGKGGRGERGAGPVARTGTFTREVVAELRKVIYPSRQQLLTYTVVVLVFVAAMTALVTGLDYALTRAVLALFS